MTLLYLLRLSAILFAFSLFLRGFFPIKHASKGYSTQKIKLPSLVNDSAHKIQSSSSSTSANLSPLVGEDKSYQRVVLMVIDALRADFAFGPFNFLPKTFNIVNNGHGLQFTAEAQPPTVTLPRIKAITTGSMPSFVDVVLNFQSPSLEEDNFITQMKIDGRKVIFYGDDTWIKLFPNHFERSDGTTSFFVSDYTEVDFNVTRHLKTELENLSWDMMILHYLGLDHIGHFAGPTSPLVRPKLAEMDNVIHQIYTAMEKWNEPSLLVVCGDHGMSDQGGHGGASVGEVSVPLLLLSPHIHNKDPKHAGSVSQTDICPTLSVLMGLPIPKNSLGKVITDALVGYSLHQKVSVIHQNAVQAMQILKSYVQNIDKESSYMLYIRAQQEFRDWLSMKNSKPSDKWEEQGQRLLIMYTESLRLLAERVGKLATQYDVYAMALSMLLLWMLLASLIFSHLSKDKNAPPIPLSKHTSRLLTASGAAVLSHITMCTGGVPSDLVCHFSSWGVGVQLAVASIFVASCLHLLTQWSRCQSLVKQFKQWKQQSGPVEIFLVVGTVAHSLTLLSSSFVEEEHQTYYFLTSTIHLLFLLYLVCHYLKSRSLDHHFENLNESTTFSKSKESGDANQSQKNLYDSCKYNSALENSDLVHSKGIAEEGARVVMTDKDLTEQESSSSTAQSNNVSQQREPSGLSYTEILRNSESEHIIRKDTTVKERTSSLMNDRMSLTDFLHYAFSLVAVLIILRVLRRWNQTGNKWLSVPDIGDWLVRPENKFYLSMTVVFSLMIIGATRGQRLKRVQSMCVNLSLTAIYFYRVAVGSLFFPSTWFLSKRGMLEARASFLFLGLTFLISVLPPNFLRLENRSPVQKTKSYQAKTKQSSQASKEHRGGKSPSTRENQSIDLNRKHQLEQETKSIKGKAFEPSTIGRHKASKYSSVATSSQSSNKDEMEEDEGTGTFTIHQRLRGISAAFICFMCLVMRPHNTPVVALMSLVEQMVMPVIERFHIKPAYTLLYCLWMGQAFFFFQGNSNSLSTVDVAAGYTGLQEYIPAVTGLILGLTTYAGLIFWIFTYIRIVFAMHDNGTIKSRLSTVWIHSCNTLLLSCALPVSVYTVLVSAQRYHLFVWTVFSPKLLYQGANTLIIGVLAVFLLLLSCLCK